MSVTAAEVASLCAEIDRELRHATIQKVAEPARWTIVLGTPRSWLLLCVAPELGRLHLLPRKPPGSGESPSAFCMLLRKHLEGARLLSCAPVAGERAAALEFARGDERCQLRVFLFGRAAQLVLVDAERVWGSYGPARALHAELPLPRAVEPGARIAHPSAVIAERFGALESTLDVGHSDIRARQLLRKQRQKLERLRAALQSDIARADAAADKRKLADLLLAHLHEVPRGASSVTLPDDFTDGQLINIALAPDRSARANAERFYAEHKRLSRARSRIEARLDEACRALAALAVDEAALDAGQPIVDGPSTPAPRAARARPDAPALPYREYRSATGSPIFVGKGADKNDALTFGVAAGRDLWLHARDVPGAHVVVPTSGRPVDEQTLLDAATLAAHFSQARGEAQVDITYATKKNVRKAKGRGRVTIAEAKTLRIRLEADRLARLLAAP